MKKELLLVVALLFSIAANAQNLHTQSNAASILNESNATVGWTGNAAITSSSVNPFQGAFSLSATSTGTTGNTRDMNYTFNAVVGQVYNISIWAREGNLSFNPAFANWTGFAGFSTTPITGANWNEYTWSLTATSTTPIIRVYTAPWTGGQVGSQVLIDNVSITTPDTTPPTAPTNLLASNTTSTGTTLNWTASTDNVAVTGYTVFQDAVQIGTTNGTTTTFDVTGLTASTGYGFTVTANDAVPNTSVPSNTANVTTTAAPDTEAPTAPTNLLASNTTSTGTTLNWTASTDNVAVTGYTVFQDAVQIGTTNGTTTTFDVTGLTASTGYGFTVTANDAVPNTSVPSNTANVTTTAAPDTEAPTAPTNLLASNTTSTGTTLNWTASTDNVAVTGYTVFQDAVQIGTTNGTTTTFDVTGLTASTGYGFTVTANDAVPNTSVPSNTANVTTTAAPDTEAPTAPTNLLASNTTSTGTTLNWTASTDNVAVTGYTVFQDAVQIGTTNGTTTTFDVTGLTASTGYGFTVTANDAVPNTSVPSNTANVTTTAAPDTEAPTAPTNLLASNTTSTGTTLNWTASTDNVAVTGYTVFQDAVQIGTTNGTTTTFDVTGLTASTGYGFTVTANDAVPNTSVPSNTANVTTTAAPDTEAPTAPTNLLASNTTSTGTTLNWTASTDNVAVTGYTVFQDAVQIGTTNGTTTTFDVTGLTASTGYGFTVTANDAVPNTSVPSNTANVTTTAAPDTEAPTAPTNLLASNTTSTGTTLNWTASTDNVAVTGYTVFQDAVQIGTTNGTTTTFDVTGLTASTGYGFTVTANDAVPNTSVPSNTANVTTTAAPDTEAPTAPTNLLASNTTSTGTTLNWTASTDNVAVTGYTVFQDAVQIGTTNGTTTTFDVTGLTASTGYGFTVTANDAVPNTSVPSNTANVTTTEGILHYTAENANLNSVDWRARDLTADQNIFVTNGNIGIGTTNTQGYRLAVDGNVVAEEIKVELSQNWPDFVFARNYGLPTLEEVEKHILEKGHLENIPNAKEVELNGIKLGEMNAKLLQKIEELTLYTIQQEKKIIKLENDNRRIQLLSEKLLELEKIIKGKQ